VAMTAPIERAHGIDFVGIRRLEREGEQTLPSSARAENAWSSSFVSFSWYCI
jgi:hypothetical protein